MNQNNKQEPEPKFENYTQKLIEAFEELKKKYNKKQLEEKAEEMFEEMNKIADKVIYDEKILYEKVREPNRIQIISIEGERGYSFDTEGKDRLFLIRLCDLVTNIEIEWPISHEEQLRIMELVLKNDIKPEAFVRHWNMFNNKLTEIKNARNGLKDTKPTEQPTNAVELVEFLRDKLQQKPKTEKDTLNHENETNKKLKK